MSKPMTNETEVLSEADEFEALLPWYVSGQDQLPPTKPKSMPM